MAGDAQQLTVEDWRIGFGGEGWSNAATARRSGSWRRGIRPPRWRRWWRSRRSASTSSPLRGGGGGRARRSTARQSRRQAAARRGRPGGAAGAAEDPARRRPPLARPEVARGIAARQGLVHVHVLRGWPTISARGTRCACAPHAHAAQPDRASPSSSSPWLQSLRRWSLRETRRGSWRKADIRLSIPIARKGRTASQMQM